MTIALTHVPSDNMSEGLRTQSGSGAIDIELARRQHADYRRLLEQCGLSVRLLDVNRNLPDAVFIEDTAVVLDELAVLCSMGHPARRPERFGILAELQRYHEVRQLQLPATMDGGDVLRIGRRMLVGLSSRTNRAGAEALSAIVGPLGYHVDVVRVTGCLHLKTACTALPDGRLLVHPDWLDTRDLHGFTIVTVPPDEPGGANVLAIGSTVVAAAAFPGTAEIIRRLGFEVLATDLSEFAKADGSVTCLSLLMD